MLETTPTPSRSSTATPENDVFAISTTFIPQSPPKTAGTASLEFDGLLSSPLLLHEDLHNGCGGQLWPAGMVLSRYLLTTHRTNLADKSILELGAGGGLVGLTVALGCKLGSSPPLVITDQEVMLALMEKNIILNNLQGKVTAVVYDWGTSPPPAALPVAPSTHPDIVLAADCVYFEPAFPLLLRTLDDLVGPRTVCYFCFKKRRKADMRFIREMTKRFEVKEVMYDNRDSDRREGIFLYTLRRK